MVYLYEGDIFGEEMQSTNGYTGCHYLLFAVGVISDVGKLSQLLREDLFKLGSNVHAGCSYEL